MIKRDTVFILGAGASREVGYPTGSELRQRICIKLNKNNKDSDLFRAARFANPDHFSESRLQEFKGLFEASYLTIDQFIEENYDFRDIGRFVIAHEILSLEDEVTLTNLGNTSWYSTFKNALGPTLRHLQESRVTIITFNYDRSLDHYLYSAFHASGGRNPTTQHLLKDSMTALGIIHVHGGLAPLPWMDKNGLAYGSVKEPAAILDCGIHNVLMVHEESRASHAGQPLSYWINNAKEVVFLGFGFDQRNMDKLDLSRNGGTSYYATTTKLDPRRKKEVVDQFGMQTFETIKELFEARF